jgi:hypothetical protein
MWFYSICQELLTEFFRSLLGDPAHERHEEMLDWIGEFDPKAFSVESVNRMLTPLHRRRDNTSRG